MNAVVDETPSRTASPPARGGATSARASTPAPALRALVVCDLVDSTALVERIGDVRAAELFRAHQRRARDLLHQHQGREIDKTDGFLLLFERPVQALAFALAYEAALRELAADEKIPLRARLGVHVGEVIVYDNAPDDVAQGAKPTEVEGLAKPIAARLMSLALPGQILVSEVTRSIAQRNDATLREQFPALRWKHHGRYRFKGVADAMRVYEIGETGTAPFLKPMSTDKAWRDRPLILRPKAILLELAAVLAVVVAISWMLTRPQPALAFAERDWIVVGDLRNLTGQSVFDESLEVAFRLSLEQSRFVNVVPELEVRNTLQRMRRPGETLIDRAVGSEIALREGARAFVLPTVAEIGGRVRVSAEVIDPATQTTIYAEFADGRGAESALSSIDAVARTMRARLGETIEHIDNDSAPLPEVVTSDLEALRAYGLGLKADGESRYADAIALYGRAIELDPQFALAHVGLARTNSNAGETESARRHLARALELRDHLPRREQLTIDGWNASLSDPVLALSKWKLLGDMYPDHHGAFYNVALTEWYVRGDYAAAASAAERATDEHYPFRASGHYLEGVVALGRNDAKAALDSFERAQALGVGGTVMAHADALLAAGRVKDAEAVMAATRASGIEGAEALDDLFPMTLALDRGDLAGAREAAIAARERWRTVRPGAAFTYGLQVASLDLLEERGAKKAPDRWQALLSTARDRDALREREAGSRVDTQFALAAIAYLAARDGEIATAKTALASASLPNLTTRSPNGARLVALASARIELAGAKGDAARRAVLARVDRMLDENALYQTGVVLRDVAASLSDADAVARAERWLAAHRGRAFAEATGAYALRAANVADAAAVRDRVAR